MGGAWVVPFRDVAERTSGAYLADSPDGKSSHTVMGGELSSPPSMARARIGRSLPERMSRSVLERRISPAVAESTRRWGDGGRGSHRRAVARSARTNVQRHRATPTASECTQPLSATDRAIGGIEGGNPPAVTRANVPRVHCLDQTTHLVREQCTRPRRLQHDRQPRVDLGLGAWLAEEAHHRLSNRLPLDKEDMVSAG